MKRQFKIREGRKQTDWVDGNDLYHHMMENGCQERLDKLKQTKVRKVTSRLVRSIMREYFKMLFEDAIYKGKRVSLFQWFGYLYAAKTLCTRYNPKSFYFVTENGKRIRKERKIDVNKTGGYFYFMFWDAPLKWRNYRLKVSRRWSSEIYQNALSGFEYIDISLLNNSALYQENTWHKRQDYTKKGSQSKQ